MEVLYCNVIIFNIIYFLCFRVGISNALLPPKVEITQGTLSGFYTNTINNKQIYGFRAIPYAEPPLGKLRFKEPIPAKAWKGVLNATSHSDVCTQLSHVTYLSDTPVIGSEDCLYLNVYTPKISVNDYKGLMNVLVYIHGGAFMYGSGTDYSPDYLLDEDIVLVTINYRLGVLGFLSTEDTVLPGNNGMKDQVLALKWVRDNIKSFGGNPGKVTIAGMSAGGASVHFHLLSPLSKGLFHKAISVSGTALCPWAMMENAKEKANKLATHLNCSNTNSENMVECLRQKPAEVVVEAARIFQPWLYYPFSPFAVTKEPESSTSFLHNLPVYTIVNKLANDVPWLNTFDKEEGLYPGGEILSDDKYINKMDEEWDRLLPHLLDFNLTVQEKHLPIVTKKIREFYLGNKDIKENWQDFIRMQSDRLFFFSIAQALKLHAVYYKSPVHAFMFAYFGSRSISEMFMPRTTKYNGVCHGDDLGYVIKASYFPINDNQEDLKVVKRIVNIWATFIKGKPMPKKWSKVNDVVPHFSYYLLKSTNYNEDEVVRVKEFGNETFWMSLPLNENIVKQNLHKVDVKDEL